MVQIEVKTDKYSYPVYLNEDGEFRCPHENVEIEAPCCSGRDSEGLISCGCYGQYSVYCNDCNNDDVRDYEVDSLIEANDPFDPDWEYEQQRDLEMEMERANG